MITRNNLQSCKVPLPKSNLTHNTGSEYKNCILSFSGCRWLNEVPVIHRICSDWLCLYMGGERQAFPFKLDSGWILWAVRCPSKLKTGHDENKQKKKSLLSACKLTQKNIMGEFQLQSDGSCSLWVFKDGNSVCWTKYVTG